MPYPDRPIPDTASSRPGGLRGGIGLAWAFASALALGLTLSVPVVAQDGSSAAQAPAVGTASPEQAAQPMPEAVAEPEADDPPQPQSLVTDTSTEIAEPAPAGAPMPETASPAGDSTPEEQAGEGPTTAAAGEDGLTGEAVDGAQAETAEAPAQPETETLAVPPVQPALQGTAPQIPVAFAHDLTPRGMFMAADWVVKGVMIGLAAAALATLVIWLVKTAELWTARGRARRGLAMLLRSERLEEAIAALSNRRGAVALMVRAAEEEARLSLGAIDHAGSDGLKERVASRLSRLVAAAGRRLSKGTGILATVGSVAPFVGLFGTVWGIMNSFVSIAETETTNLAVVAPGIAEALLATAIGLVAAIPAVIIYNGFARGVTGYRQVLVDAASAIERLVSRDLDWRLVPAPPPVSSLNAASALPLPPSGKEAT